MAANECGAVTKNFTPGQDVVVCTSVTGVGNPYSNGISYDENTTGLPVNGITLALDGGGSATVVNTTLNGATLTGALNHSAEIDTYSGASVTAGGNGLVIATNGTGSTTISNAGTVSAGGVGIQTNSAGAGQILITNTGTVSAGSVGIQINPGVTGPITIVNAGTVSGNVLGIQGANLAITNSGSVSGGVDFTGGSNTLTLNGGSITGNIAIDAGTLTINQSIQGITYGINNVITGSGSVIINGNGELQLNGVSTYTGGTFVQAGTLQTFLGTLGATSGSVTVSGGTLDLGSTSQIQDGGVTLTGGTIQNGNLSSAAGFAVQNGTISANLEGTGALTKTGSGTVILSGFNTYTGGTTISAGILQIASLNALTGNVLDNAELDYNTGNYVIYSGAITGSGSLHLIGGAGSLVLTGTNTYSGGTVISSGALLIGNHTSTGSITGNVVDNITLAFIRDDNYTFSGNISGLGELDQDGIGTLTLTGSNTHSGPTVLEQGVLQVLGDPNIGTGSVQMTGGTLRFLASNTSHLPYELGVGAIDTNGMTVTLSGVLSTQTGVNVAAGYGGLTKIGSGTLILTGTNTYQGPTMVSAGALSISSDANLGTGNSLSLAAGTILDITATGTYSHPVKIAGDPTFDVASGQTVTYRGMIADGASAGTLNKTDSGTLILTAADTYTGGTIVNAGTLTVMDHWQVRSRSMAASSAAPARLAR